MASLYQLTAELLQLFDMARDEDVDPKCLEDTMDMVQGTFVEKADGYGKVIRQLTVEAESIDQEIRRLQARKKRILTNIDRMKSHLQNAMEVTGLRKFQAVLFSFAIRACPPKVVIDEVFIENIPDEYLVYDQPTIDKLKIKEDLKAGKDLGGLAHLEAAEVLSIT